MGLENVDALNFYLTDKSYIEGFQPSQADVVVFEAYATAPTQVHAARWWNHINSFGDKRKSFAAAAHPSTHYVGADSVFGSAGAAAAEDDFDLFGDDEEVDAEAERIKAERIAAYEAKKATKPVLIAKSSILFDIKPWDDTTDMKELENLVRGIEMDGLLWGASKLLPVAFGVKKLQIMVVIEDDKVSTDVLEEMISEFEDYVQSVDIAAFNKI